MKIHPYPRAVITFIPTKKKVVLSDPWSALSEESRIPITCTTFVINYEYSPSESYLMSLYKRRLEEAYLTSSGEEFDIAIKAVGFHGNKMFFLRVRANEGEYYLCSISDTQPRPPAHYEDNLLLPDDDDDNDEEEEGEEGAESTEDDAQEEVV